MLNISGPSYGRHYDPLGIHFPMPEGTRTHPNTFPRGPRAGSSKGLGSVMEGIKVHGSKGPKVHMFRDHVGTPWAGHPLSLGPRWDPAGTPLGPRWDPVGTPLGPRRDPVGTLVGIAVWTTVETPDLFLARGPIGAPSVNILLLLFIYLFMFAVYFNSFILFLVSRRLAFQKLRFSNNCASGSGWATHPKPTGIDFARSDEAQCSHLVLCTQTFVWAPSAVPA